MASSNLKPASSRPQGPGAESRPLSAREREVVGLLAEGMSGAAIAERLVLSPETVRTHVRNAMDKLGASTRSQAVALALEQGQIGDGAAGSQHRAPTARPGDERGLQGALQGVADELAALPDIDGVAVYVAAESGMVLRLEGLSLAPAGGGERFPRDVVLGEGGVGRVALERRAQLVTTSGSGSALAAPLVAGGRLFGVIALAIRPSRPVSRREILLLEAFGQHVAQVLDGERSPAAPLRRAAQRFRASWTGALGLG